MDDAHLVLNKLREGTAALDERPSTLGVRFQGYGIPNSLETRGQYRLMMVESGEFCGLGSFLFHEEMFIFPSNGGGRLIDILNTHGMVPIVKVDEGLEKAGEGNAEWRTRGLGEFPGRIEGYKDLGILGTKWRELFILDDQGHPSRGIVEEGARRLARFSKISGDAGFFSFPEPEIERDKAAYGAEKMREVYGPILQEVVGAFIDEHVDLGKVFFKVNLIAPSKGSKEAFVPSISGEMTYHLLKKAFPSGIGGIKFLSGGIPRKDYLTALSLMRNRYAAEAPWHFSFSAGRALQEEVLPLFAKWYKGQTSEQKTFAQEAFRQAVKEHALAMKGEYK
ncbi:fructose-bisphosphate aldolase [Candidatus Woesearchaeota archaeon]|nr:fructose-bisphosphate aldolase [Candidatus Woesearchaeota archaeon]